MVQVTRDLVEKSKALWAFGLALQIRIVMIFRMLSPRHYKMTWLCLHSGVGRFWHLGGRFYVRHTSKQYISSQSNTIVNLLTVTNMVMPNRSRLIAGVLFLALLGAVSASSGDRNPTFQHCLKGCGLTYCDPSQPPISLYLRAFGWTCEDDCKYQCAQSFTDNIRQGSKWHQCTSHPPCRVFVLTRSLR